MVVEEGRGQSGIEAGGGFASRSSRFGQVAASRDLLRNGRTFGESPNEPALGGPGASGHLGRLGLVGAGQTQGADELDSPREAGPDHHGSSMRPVVCLDESAPGFGGHLGEEETAPSTSATVPGHLE